MDVHEFRIRYAVPEMFHQNDRSRDIIHAVVCDINMVKPYCDKIKACNYPIVGIDDRIRDDQKYISIWDGWKEMKREGNKLISQSTT